MKEWTIEREAEQVTGLSKVAAATKERNEGTSLLSERASATQPSLGGGRGMIKRERVGDRLIISRRVMVWS